MKKICIFVFILFFLFAFDEVKAIELPLCDDARILGIISEQIKEIGKSNNINSPTNTRTSELALKYAKIMEDVNIENFKQEEDFSISDKIMELKMNKYLTFSDMRLCKGMYEKVKNKIYALIYRDGENVTAFVITALSDQRKETEKMIEN